MLDAKRAVNIPDVPALPDDHELRRILDPQNIKSILFLPLHHEGNDIGFVGLDSVRARFDFGSAETELLKVLAEILVNIMLRKSREEAVNRTRKQLEASEERYRRLYETMSQGVVYQDGNRAVTSANPAACRILGLSEKTLKGKSCADFNWQLIDEHGRPVPDEEHPVALALKTGKKTGPVIRGLVLAQSRPPVWLSVTAIPLFSPESAAPVKAYAIFEDITQEKTAREKADLSHKRLVTVLDSINAVIYVADMQTHEILFLNKAARDDMGDASGKKCWQMIQAGQKGPCPFCTNHKLVDQDGNPTGVYRWEFQNSRTGRWYDCHDLAIKWVDGRVVRLESAIDITDRKEAERVLKEQHRLLEGILDNIPDIMSVKSPDMSVVLYNQAGYDFLDKQPEDIQGKKCFQVIDRDSPCLQCATQEALKTRNKATVEKYLPELNRHLNCRAKPILDEQGQVEYIVELIRDITDRKKNEERIRSMNQALEKSNAEKDKFFSIIAHDLKSPLSGILASSQVVVGDPGSLTRDELEYVVSEIHKSASVLMELLDDLLQWSRVSRGSIEYLPKVLDLAQVMESSLKPLKNMARKKGIDLQIHVPAGQEIRADRFMVSTIIRNLVSNAVKFTCQGGKVRIAAKQSNPMVSIRVADTGVGMDRELADKLFSMDRGKSRIGTEGEKGTGLGLVICREFVERHGGEIMVDSRPGQGTVVEVTLPAADSAMMDESL